METSWKFIDARCEQVEKITATGNFESCFTYVIAEWIAQGNTPAPASSPPLVELRFQVKAEALPIRSKALDVLSGLAVDCLVASNAAGAALCKGARDRVKAMGTLDLSGCADYEAMRRAFKAEWAAISLTFASQPELRTQFNRALA